MMCAGLRETIRGGATDARAAFSQAEQRTQGRAARRNVYRITLHTPHRHATRSIAPRRRPVKGKLPMVLPMVPREHDVRTKRKTANSRRRTRRLSRRFRADDPHDPRRDHAPEVRLGDRPCRSPENALYRRPRQFDHSHHDIFVFSDRHEHPGRCWRHLLYDLAKPGARVRRSDRAPAFPLAGLFGDALLVRRGISKN
jgi:hypothetical protein